MGHTCAKTTTTKKRCPSREADRCLRQSVLKNEGLFSRISRSLSRAKWFYTQYVQPETGTRRSADTAWSTAMTSMVPQESWIPASSLWDFGESDRGYPHRRSIAAGVKISKCLSVVLFLCLDKKKEKKKKKRERKKKRKRYGTKEQ